MKCPPPTYEPSIHEIPCGSSRWTTPPPPRRKAAHKPRATRWPQPHTLIVGIATRQRTRNFSSFKFYFLNPTTTLLGRRLPSHLSRRRGRTSRTRSAGGGWPISASLVAYGPPFCAAVVGSVQRLLPHGMTWWNWGVVLPYYTEMAERVVRRWRWVSFWEN